MVCHRASRRSSSKNHKTQRHAMRDKITIQSVKALTPGGIISDTNPTGFVARCQKSGQGVVFLPISATSGPARSTGPGLASMVTITPAQRP